MQREPLREALRGLPPQREVAESTASDDNALGRIASGDSSATKPLPPGREQSSLVQKLVNSPRFRHVAAWIGARQLHGGVVPPLTPYHTTGCHLLFPTLTALPFHDDPNAYPPRLAEAVLLLERLAPIVRREFNSLREQTGFQPFRGRSTTRPAAADSMGHLTHDAGDWSVFYLMAGGVDCASRQAQCPKTTRLLRGLPGQCNSAFFSILQPGTHICAHCGPGNFRLRLHLGLHVPDSDACRIRCADQTRQWREGKVLVLDDSFEHEVWNAAPAPRAVLCVDIWHPDFSMEEVQLLEATLQRGDARVASRGESLIASVMAAHAERNNACLFEGFAHR